FAPYRCHGVLSRNSERWKMGANRVRDVARRQVRVVLFGHPRVGMAELLGNDAHRHAAHGQRRAMRMSQYVERNGGLDLRPITCIQHRPQLVRLAPYAPVTAYKDWIAGGLTGGQGRKEPLPFGREDHMAWLARLALAHD